MKAMDNNKQETVYFLSDKGQTILLHVLLDSSLHEEILSLRLAKPMSRPPDIMRYAELELIDTEKKTAVQCSPVQQSGEKICVKRNSEAYSMLRNDLRVPVRFMSFCYPINGGWAGRRDIQAVDLSCGGMAFSSTAGLEDGEQVELVLPITTQPIVARCQILHHRPLDEKTVLYSAKFVDLCGEEESMVRKAVFDVQLELRRRKQMFDVKN